MSNDYVRPGKLAEPPEPYSHAVKSGDTIYVAGQVAFDGQNQVVGVGDARAQAEQVWENIAAAVEAAGGSVTDVVKITVFLKDIRDAKAEIEIRKKFFEAGHYPICTQVQVANLGLPDLLMEVDAIAVIDSSTST
jgi:reactive intermediate/imine deaminase